MAIDRDTAFELADLNRKLTTAQALLSYERKCAETRALEAVEEQRQLRVRLIHIEPEYKHLLQDMDTHEKYIKELEEVLKVTNKRLAWSEGAIQKHKKRTKELEEKLQSKLLSEGTERGALAAELEELKSEHTTLKEKLKWSEKELEQASQQNIDSSFLLATQRDDLLAAQKEAATLKEENATLQEDAPRMRSEIATLKERLQDHVDRLQKSITSKQALQAEFTAAREAHDKEVATLRLELEDAHGSAKHAVDEAKRSAKREALIERQALEKELATLRLELDDAQKTAKRLQDAAASSAKDTSSKTSKQELITLQASLKRETKVREKAEKDLSQTKEDLEARIKVLESKLESTRAKFAAHKAAPPAAASTTTKIPLKENPLKRPGTHTALTMEDLEQSAKRIRKEGPKTSEFSITPFLKKQAAVTTDSPATPSADARGDAANATSIMDDDPGERSIMIPAVVESKEPTRLLLAGAARKRKAIKITAAAIPEIPEEPASPTATPDPEPKPKSKPRGKKPAAVAQIEKPSIFDSPSSIPVPKPKENPKPRKRKPAATAAVDTTVNGRGIKPTVFDEDDGTGRLVLNVGAGDSQGPTAGPSKAGGKLGGGAGLGLGAEGLILAPAMSAFNKDFSPAKKRPDVLKKLFAGGKK